MAGRKRISKTLEVDILYQSGRRCCACFGLNGDFRQKQGQIAHLDQNNQNDKPDNLAFMCLEHHDQYDSKSSQSKGLSIGEIKRYREMLYQAMNDRRELAWPASAKTSFNITPNEVAYINNLLVECRENLRLLKEQASAYGLGAIPTDIERRLAHETSMVKTLEEQLADALSKQKVAENETELKKAENRPDLSSLNLLIIENDVHWQQIYVEIATAFKCQSTILDSRSMFRRIEKWQEASYDLAIIGIPSPQTLSESQPLDVWHFLIGQINQITPIIFMVAKSSLPASTFSKTIASNEGKKIVAVIQKQTFSYEWFEKMLKRAALHKS